ncbi:ABC transporter permease subunit [Nocardioides nanhaiensis]|uniref:Maltose/maltodextrin transport system permease protein n=1 Tax=Nocardioides nanhaiensis TaxID=1476871 RepID=A0ABP8W3Z4_9ACTN
MALLARILGLGLALAVAIALTPTLVLQEQWLLLVPLWVIVGGLLAVYATGRFVPGKYLLPGTLLLTVFVLVPIVLTAQLSTTNFGDGTRTTKAETVERILAQSFVQTPDTTTYQMTVGTTGSPVTGPFVLYLVDPATDEVLRGDEQGLEPVEGAEVDDAGRVTAAPEGDVELLTPSEVNAASAEVLVVAVPTDGGEIRPVGVSRAIEGTTRVTYDEASDTFIDAEDGTTYTVQADGDRDYYVDAEGERLSEQSWRQGVGLSNYQRIFTDDRISRDFLSIFAWTLIFATVSVLTTFALGLGLAITMNDRRLRGQKVYRAAMIIPYAIPGFISLLVWASFYNTDFGLINDLTGLSVDWFGGTWSARFAVILTNLWMGFPYMFLVCTGALQAIPEDLKEASSLDGASGFAGFRRVTLPLLLVAVAPVLVATFAFNFNNYNTIALLTEGGPFDPANPTAGGTDILISYTIRLAFGAGGAEIGFASAVSMVLFVLTGVIAALQFRATRRLEDVN